MLRFPRAVVTAGATAGLVLGGAAPALAGPGDQLSPGSDGKNLSVVVVSVTGNGTTHGPGADQGGPDGGGRVTVEVPTPCYWSSGNGAYTGRKFYDTYYNDGKRQNFGVSGLALPSRADMDEHKDEDGYWYFVGTTDAGGRFSLDDQLKCDRELQAANGSGYVFVPAGEDPPPLPPAVIPAVVLAQIARDAMGAPDPVVERSPGGNSVVQVPTWFWVQDDEGDDTDGFAELEVVARAGTNEATVTATPGRFTVTSAAFDEPAECTAAQATLEWARGLADSAGCSAAPTRSSASQAGLEFRATAQTNYVVTWTGIEDGNPVPGGGLDPLSAQSTFGFAVAEVQAVVTGG